MRDLTKQHSKGMYANERVVHTITNNKILIFRIDIGNKN